MGDEVHRLHAAQVVVRRGEVDRGGGGVAAFDLEVEPALAVDAGHGGAEFGGDLRAKDPDPVIGTHHRARSSGCVEKLAEDPA